MVSMQSSPVFVKTIGALLIFCAVLDIVFTFAGSNYTGLTEDERISVFIGLLIYSALTVIMIIIVYGIVMSNRLCWLLCLVGLFIRVYYHAFKFIPEIDLVPMIATVASILVLFYPDLLRYCFRKQTVFIERQRKFKLRKKKTVEEPEEKNE